MRNLKISSVLVGLLVVGCSTRADQIGAAGPETPQPIAETPSSSVALAVDQQVSSDTEEASLVDECSGADLDLATLAVQRTCDLARTANVAPAGLHVSLASPQLTALPGETIETKLMLTNTTDAPMALELDASCGFASVVSTEIHQGVIRLDEMGTECEPVYSCAGHAIAVNIDPQQSAFIRLEVTAAAVVSNDTCELFRGRGLAPGKYTVEFHTRLAPEPLVAQLTVRAPGA